MPHVWDWTLAEHAYFTSAMAHCTLEKLRTKMQEFFTDCERKMDENDVSGSASTVLCHPSTSNDTRSPGMALGRLGHA